MVKNGFLTFQKFTHFARQFPIWETFEKLPLLNDLLGKVE